MLDARDARLAAHRRRPRSCCWFEDDLFDDLQLAQIADRLAGRPGPRDAGPAPARPARRSPRPPSRARSRSRPTRAAFAALRAPDPRGWAEHRRMDRLLEELPDARTGLSRLEREILEALAAGPLAPATSSCGRRARAAALARRRRRLRRRRRPAPRSPSSRGDHWQLAHRERRAVLDGDAVRPPTTTGSEASTSPRPPALGLGRRSARGGAAGLTARARGWGGGTRTHVAGPKPCVLPANRPPKALLVGPGPGPHARPILRCPACQIPPSSSSRPARGRGCAPPCRKCSTPSAGGR